MADIIFNESDSSYEVIFDGEFMYSNWSLDSCKRFCSKFNIKYNVVTNRNKLPHIN